MATQSNSASPIRRTRLTGLEGVGWLLMGLLLGLLIGWVLWPVEWEGAGVDDLNPAARAHYISATADAYMASGGQDPSTTLARMQAFADPQAAVREAIAFYQQSSDPNRAIREVNLRGLASALNARPAIPASSTTEEPIGWLNWILAALAALLLLAGGLWIGRRLWARSAAPSPRSTRPVPPPLDPAAHVPTRTQTPPPPTRQPSSAPAWRPGTPINESARAGLEQSTHQQQADSSVTFETWDSPHDAPLPDRVSPPVHAQPTQDTEEFARILPSRDHPSDTNNTDDDAFAEEGFVEFTGIPRVDTIDEDDTEEDDRSEERWDTWSPESRRKAGGPQPATAATLEDDENGWFDDWGQEAHGSDDENSDNEWDDETDDETDDEFSDEFAKGQNQHEAFADEDIDGFNANFLKTDVEISPWSSDEETIRPAKSPVPEDMEEDDEEEAGGFLPTVQGVLSSWRGEKREVQSSQENNEISTFTAQYSAGIPAYAQSFTIRAEGSEDGTALGACGMAVSEEFDKSAAHSDKVHVLDVWLYDGGLVRTFKQYLVSPGVDKESLASQAPSVATITGEPLEITSGLTFRITAKHLILDCRIINADMLRDDVQPSPLRTVQLEMKVSAAK